MNVLIVDDEPLARERLRRLVRESGATVAGEAPDGATAVRMCAADRPEVVLLDIRMPGMNGLETARHLSGLRHPPVVVFTTAYGDHALEAFEAEAIAYLLKPVRLDRLERALERAAKLTAAKLAGLGDGSEAPTHLTATAAGHIELIPVDEVLYLRAEQKYVLARHRRGGHLLDESLKDLERQLGGGFLRIHRNALVARKAIGALEKSPGGYVLRLHSCSERLDVSRRHLPALRRLLRSCTG